MDCNNIEVRDADIVYTGSKVVVFQNPQLVKDVVVFWKSTPAQPESLVGAAQAKS